MQHNERVPTLKVRYSEYKSLGTCNECNGILNVIDGIDNILNFIINAIQCNDK